MFYADCRGKTIFSEQLLYFTLTDQQIDKVPDTYVKADTVCRRHKSIDP